MVISLVIRSTIPYFWPIEALVNYEEVLDEKFQGINMLFIGTSRIANGVKPSLFDKHMKNNHDRHIRSFNLGIPGASVGENCALARHFINSKRFSKLKYVVIELTSMEHAIGGQFCGPKNLHKPRTLYWMNRQNLAFSLDNLAGQSNISYAKKFRLGINYCVAYVANIFNAGMFQDFFKIKLGFIEDDNFGKGHKNSRGFRDVEKNSSPELLKKHKEHVKTKGKLSNLKAKKSKNFFGKDKKQIPPLKNEKYLENLKDLITEAKEKNVKVIFVVPPLIEVNSYRLLASVYQKLPIANKVQITNAATYPELYKYKNIYDGSHLTKEGANILTRYLAAELDKKLVKKKNKTSNTNNKNKKNNKKKKQ